MLQQLTSLGARSCGCLHPSVTPVAPSRRRCSAVQACRQAQEGTVPPPPAAAQPPLLQRLRSAALAGALSATLALAPISATSMDAWAQPVAVSNDTPVLDLARVVPSGQLEGLQQQLRDLESETGWRVRMLTRYGSDGPSDAELRAGWRTDERTVVILVDPSSPNIMNFKFGREVRSVLSAPFFTELQGRFGNMFAVREMGESAAVMNMVDTLTGCLARGGCAVVPGLSADHYYFTLAVSLAGGVVAGAASKLEPSGFVQRRWVWVALFAPLWGSLFVNFGLGPVISRTDDLLPLVGNIVAFGVAAAAVGYSPKISKAVGLTTDEDAA
ncbi:methanol dehydrogenase [Chlorella sorokiniana]|uniref:Methanol dehydrogenase n=1 Tax=Chlorella sorokiniana TaxID=3076 RepID=A0A2P6TPR4_CHLSO|nr:methanol dehydrogenase [Chlorella sorokiniana]|eukprot:PRW56026.1 methanol dehydrogenase [Chlorella sorokiniana]